MGKRLLPYVEPMYSTYHSLANSGIPAKQNSTSDIWFYNNTVEWCCSRKFLQGYTSPEMGLYTGYLGDLPFLEQHGINTRFARRCALDLIKTMLDEGYYVSFGGVDDYYVKGKSWYHDRHFNHDGLILGYDDDAKTLTIAAYDQRWIYNVFDTPQDCFLEGLQALCDKSSYGELQAVRATDERQKLDLSKIYEDINKYLSASIDAFSFDNPGPVSGIIVYDFICMYLDKLADGSIPHERRDRRVFRLIWEHKKCMLGRIKAIEDKCNWDNWISSTYSEIVSMSDKIRFIYSKFTIKFSYRDLENIQMSLMQMKKLEDELLNCLLQRLR